MTGQIHLTATLARGYEARIAYLTVQKARNKWALYARDLQGYSVRAHYANDATQYPPRFESRKLALAWCAANGLKAGYITVRRNGARVWQHLYDATEIGASPRT